MESAMLNTTKQKKVFHKDGVDHSNDGFYLESLRSNTKVLATSSDWLTLACLEPLMAKKHKARLNDGEKAMRTLNLF